MHRQPSRFVRTAAAVLLSFACAHAQEDTARATTGRQALVEARTLAAQAKGKKGPERDAALIAGARAFEKVATDWAADVAIAAEASFEAAELWRRKGDLPEAERGYRAALAADPARYEPRASFELAHLLRRGKQFDAAVELYRKVAGLQPGSARAQDALVWCGRTLQTAARLDEAVRAFVVAFEAAANSSAIVTAGNWLAKAQIRGGDLEGARTTLARVDERTKAEAAADTPAAKRLKSNLAAMTARRALQRGIDKATGAADDAAEVETDESEEGGEESEEEKTPPPGKPPVGKRTGGG